MLHSNSAETSSLIRTSTAKAVDRTWKVPAMERDECTRSYDLSSAAIFEEYRSRIYHHILHLVRDPSEAEDLTQETFLRVHRKLDVLQDRAALGVWLYRIATNVCYDRFRQSSHRQATTPIDTTSGTVDDDTQLADLKYRKNKTRYRHSELSSASGEPTAAAPLHIGVPHNIG